tara:strand:+ start:561 stop:875 length:315 start_codon:yes stop_codon:yes gene_type:complete
MFNRFLLNIFIISDVGVTTAKKTIPITIGDITLPNKIPNFIHTLFKGVKIGEFIKPKTKKNTASISDQAWIFPPSNNGQNVIIKKTVKKTTPKFLFDGKEFFSI